MLTYIIQRLDLSHMPVVFSGVATLISISRDVAATDIHSSLILHRRLEQV